ncbi:DNA cytosine methyltransferase [Lysinibacillus sp. NPDC093712]|uniref:DNA cytosine methyltransferase n=1 Tax=Lysinibacillus sp. NPDC093712 TaxID=3390579 RepID=UPI003D03CE7F
MKQLSLFREIIVDNFAGGGGASTGIEMATGMSVDIAINHDPAAIEMHKLNHPDTEHYCESVWDVDPKEACKGRKVGLAWFSPDCTHHSKAKGGTPVKQEIRGLAWIAVKWALAVKPRVIMLENVEEFKDWGPIENGNPIKELKGKTFQSFVKALESLGYEVDFRELHACDYGAPTIRKRFFMIARCDGKTIKWPEPTHGDPQSPAVQLGRLKPWRTTSEIIDWSIGAPSIFERKTPLVPNTLNRIEKGLFKFVINTDNPYMVSEDIAAYLISYYTERTENEVRGLSLNSPLHTITAGGNRFAVVYAFMTKYYGQSTAQGLNEPLHTITTKDRFALTTCIVRNQQIIDIGLRMMQPHELFAAQGFPNNYHHPGKKAEQIKRVGNSVPPPFADALVRANLPELCASSSRYAVNI